jgi:two-component system OmpR family response regulator
MSAAPATSTRPLSLLVVEDNPDVAESLAMVLRGFGHTVRIAYDGTSAVQIIKAERFDAILCDIGLPGCSGYDVASEVRCVRGRDALVVAVSAYGADAVRDAARDAGFDAFFTKPADPDAIERLLRERAR